MPQEATEDNWGTDRLFYVSPSKQSRIGSAGGIPNIPPYYGSCFLHIQDHLDRAFIKQQNASIDLPILELKAFPYPSVIEDLFLVFASALFPMLFVMSMILPVKNIIKVRKQTLSNAILIDFMSNILRT